MCVCVCVRGGGGGTCVLSGIVKLTYGGPVDCGCHDMQMRFADVHTCTSRICGLAHTGFADV